MFQTSYTGLKPLHQNRTYRGGFCQFWYIPEERVAVYPRINAANQFLTGEPLLVPGASWFGPIAVPRDQLGFTEVLKRSQAGPYYELKLSGAHAGDSPESRVNLGNMIYHRYLVVGKVRAGGFYMLIGTKKSPLRFDPDFNGGNGPAETAGTQYQFFTEHTDKAYILPAFNAASEAPGTGGGNGGSTTMIEPEIIPFNGKAAIPIPWTPVRNTRFGQFPIIEVWLQEPGVPPYLHFGGSIEIDAPPPAFSQMTVYPGADIPGFIVIK